MKSPEYYISQFESEVNRDRNFRSNLWQPVSDLILPRTNQISMKSSEGENKMRKVYNTTAMQDAEDMASGLSGTIIPNGQEFFGVSVPDTELLKINRVQRYLSHVSAKAHEKIFESNFVSQFNEALLSMIVFGPGNMFTKWDMETLGIVYRSWEIGSYTIMNDANGNAIGMIINHEMTAQEAVEEFGKLAGPKVTAAAVDPKQAMKKWEFLYTIMKRGKYNPQKSDRFNMPYEVICTNKTDKHNIRSGGFRNKPFAVAHWRKGQTEKWGRGRGIMALPAVRQIQQMEKDYVEGGNKRNNPPLLVHNSFEGRVRVTPGAQNRVSDMDSIRGIPNSAQMSTADTESQMKRKEEEIHRIFYMNVFRQFMDM